MSAADLSTTWLGKKLVTPFVIGASPLGDDLDPLEALVHAGASAVVLHSLFEEQITAEQMAAHRFFDNNIDRDAEARSFLPDTDVFGLGPEPYIRHMQRVQHRLHVPVLASLNGTTPGGWLDLAKRLADSGADALELNLYDVVTDPMVDGDAIEAKQLHVVHRVVSSVHIPVSVKLSPFYAGLPSFVERLGEAGARGVVLFNRYYQPDFDIETLDMSRSLHLSTPAELPLRLHALAMLSGRLPVDLAVTGGVHHGEDALKTIMAGAHAVQTVSALLHGGAERMKAMVEELQAAMDRAGYHSVEEARGVMSLDKLPDPHLWERLNYMHLLQGWRARGTK